MALPRSNNGEGDRWHSVKVLDATFFDRSAEDVPRELIGCRLTWRIGDQTNQHECRDQPAG
jgi:hypothetical protein